MTFCSACSLNEIQTKKAKYAIEKFHDSGAQTEAFMGLSCKNEQIRGQIWPVPYEAKSR